MYSAASNLHQVADQFPAEQTPAALSAHDPPQKRVEFCMLRARYESYRTYFSTRLDFFPILISSLSLSRLLLSYLFLAFLPSGAVVVSFGFFFFLVALSACVCCFFVRFVFCGLFFGGSLQRLAN